ncbi:MAG: tetratricopeptide repeat protein [Phormidesmis sp.]
MSKAELFAELTNLVDVDPFALLGVSVSADEKRIAKRYRQVAKFLHPDAMASLHGAEFAPLPSEQELEPKVAAAVIARIVNPSYQKLKQEKGRQAALSTLRFRVRRLARTEKLVPTFEYARQLSEVEDNQVDIFYEQALSRLAEAQFQSLAGMHTTALEICQLNLVFLHRKLETSVIRPKRAGLMTNVVTPTAAVAHTKPIAQPKLNPESDNSTSPAAPDKNAEAPEVDYARKHTARAKAYLNQEKYEMAVQELREALKIAPQSPEIHSMIGQAYYKQKLSGMAKAHFRQALKLKPTHKVARKYGQMLGLAVPTASIAKDKLKGTDPAESTKKPWLGRLLHR